MKKNYTPIYQLPYCCVLATIQWILYRRGLGIMNQEEIGAQLGLRLPVKGRDFFCTKKIIYLDKEPESGFGTQIQKKEYSINRFFDKNDINLKISNLYIMHDVKDVCNFLKFNFREDNDLIVSYNARLLSKGEYKYIGHFSLVEDVDFENKEVLIGDPQPKFFKTISFEDLVFQMSSKIDGRRRGFYIVKKK